MELKKKMVLKNLEAGQDVMFVYISIRSIWADVSWKASFSLLIFCLDDLSIDTSGVLSPLLSIIVLLSISPIMFHNICFIYLGVAMFNAYIFTIAISSSWIDLFIVM